MKNSGLFLHGVVKGIKETPYDDDNGDKKMSYKLGVSISEDDGYGGINQIIFEVKIPPNNLEEVTSQLSLVRDRFCLIPTTFNDGRFKSIKYRSGTKIQILKDDKS